MRQSDQRNITYYKMQRGDIYENIIAYFIWVKNLNFIDLFSLIFYLKFLIQQNQNGLQVIHIDRFI